MANTAQGLATTAVEEEQSLTPQITVSNSNENGDTTKAPNSDNTSTNHLQTTTANEKDKKKRPFSFGKKKSDEKILPKSDSRSDDGTNTTATKTGDAADGNGKHKAGAKETPAAALVPFFSLYRFHKPYEIALNCVGLVCAFGSGAAQVSSTYHIGVFQSLIIFHLFGSP